MSFLKSIFNKDKEPKRSLNSAKELMTGDMIVLTDSFALPEILRGQQFEVKAINSYEYEHHVQTEWVLSGTSEHDIFLTLEEDDNVLLKFALKINHSDVESLFNLDNFAQIFDEPADTYLEKQQDSTLTNGWTSEHYHQEVFAKVGFFHRKDFRASTSSPSQYEGADSGEQFELYALYDDKGDKGVDVEVWNDGDTDICLTLYRPLTDIIDFYPGS